MRYNELNRHFNEDKPNLARERDQTLIRQFYSVHVNGIVYILSGVCAYTTALLPLSKLFVVVTFFIFQKNSQKVLFLASSTCGKTFIDFPPYLGNLFSLNILLSHLS